LVGYGVKSKRLLFIIIGLGGVLASASTTALVSSTIIAIIIYVSYPQKRKKMTIKKIVISALSAIFFVSILAINWDKIVNIVFIAYDRFVGRLSSVYFGKNLVSNNVRIDYILCLPSAMIEVLPFLLLGTGFGTSTLGYARSDYARSVLGAGVEYAYDMENTYIAYLMDTGIIGFAIFITMMAYIYKKFKKSSKENNYTSAIVFCMIITSIISLMFYHYILFASQMLMFTIALSIIDEGEIVID
jgi:hypothetical protein